MAGSADHPNHDGVERPRQRATPIPRPNHELRGGRVSIRDVADLAGVSIATVSRVLNNPGLVASHTAERVTRAVGQLGYRPNLFAKGLMTKRSRVLGVSLPDWSGDSYSELMRGADERARDLGYHLMVIANAQQGQARDGMPPAFALDLVDGLIAMVTSNTVHDVDQLKRLGLPLVLLASAAEDGDLDTLELDNYSGAHEATLHLADGTDPARCAFVGGPASNRDAQRRAAAFRAALESRGHIASAGQVHHGRWSYRWGWNWAGRAHERGELAGAAVLAGNDEIAIGIAHRAKEAGLAIPRDLRLVGFDDARACTFFEPPLSSVRVPNRQVGAEAVTALVRRLTEGDDDPPMRTRIATSLVIRESSEF